MSSEAITQNDLREILSRTVGSIPSEYKKLLWTNPNPSSSFSAQTILSDVDLSEYDEFEIEVRNYITGGIYNICRFKNASQRQIWVFDTSNFTGNTIPVQLSRIIDISSSGMSISTGYSKAYNSTSAPNNSTNICLPIKIYGIKYERVAPPQLEDLTIIESFGNYNNVPATGTWTLPNTKSYKRLFLFFPVWGAYNSTTLASTPVVVNANQSTITFTNWTNRTGGVVANTTLSATVFAIRMEF